MEIMITSPVMNSIKIAVDVGMEGRTIKQYRRPAYQLWMQPNENAPERWRMQQIPPKICLWSRTNDVASMIFTRLLLRLRK